MNIRRPSPALIIACIALFVSLGGVSYGFATGSIDGREIKNGTITTKDLRNNEIRGADIRNSTIGGRDVALDTLGGNDIKESTLGKVPQADTVDGIDSSQFVRKEAPTFSPLTLSGASAVIIGEPTPGFDQDGSGYIHLQGTYTDAAGTAFTLPAGFRPAGASRFVVRQDTGTTVLTINPDGQASASGTGEVSLDGVTFAPAPQ